jgi:hypothetical protein
MQLPFCNGSTLPTTTREFATLRNGEDKMRGLRISPEMCDIASRNFGRVIRRTFAAAAVATPLLTGCFWDKHFNLSWEEEVQLHDGQIIIVKLKHTYERLQQGLTRYGGRSILRDTTITFDSGGAAGVVTQLLKGYHPLFIGQHDGDWYLTIYGAHYYRSNEIPGQNWGIHWYGCGPAAKLAAGKFEPISIHDMPGVFSKNNILLLYGDAAEMSKFEERRINLEEKNLWLITHPPGYGHAGICRPPATAVKPANLFIDERTQGVKK